MRRWIGRSAAALAALAACACARPGALVVRAPLVAAAYGDEAAAIRAVVTAFVVGEAAGEESVDSLLAGGAQFIATGVHVTNRPRLAAVPGPGTGTVVELQSHVAGDVAWAIATYTWAGTNPLTGERGLATFVLQRLPAGWRILHVHASSVERWDR